MWVAPLCGNTAATLDHKDDLQVGIATIVKNPARLTYSIIVSITIAQRPVRLWQTTAFARRIRLLEGMYAFCRGRVEVNDPFRLVPRLLNWLQGRPGVAQYRRPFLSTGGGYRPRD